MNFIQFLAGTLHSFDVTDSRYSTLPSYLSLVSMAPVMVSRAASVSEIRRQLRPSSKRERRLWAVSTSRQGLRGPQGQHSERRHRQLKYYQGASIWSRRNAVLGRMGLWWFHRVLSHSCRL